MKAIVRVKSGSVRLFGENDSKRVSEIEPVASPYEQAVEGGWGVGSASGRPAGVVAGGFEVEALEAGILRVYEEVQGAPSTASRSVAFEAGAVKSFTTHDSNALTVQATTGELAIPAKPTETVKAPASKGGGDAAPKVATAPAQAPKPVTPAAAVAPKKP